ncbi:LysR family transcriptional regulator [Massilia sp. W12]|uniref:LysR family transcriptional regulator n=1 Tax=Massilia sp. W12 TaxID=3126507 RepID=UPI0030CA692F
MKFSARHVEVFRAIMTAGSTTGAANLLHTSQPTISRELARFEKVTGLTLFKRSAGKLEPTEQGLALFEEVQRSWFGLERIAHTAQALRQFRQGQISIICLPAFSQALLPRVCARFCRAFPGISVNITPEETPLMQQALAAQRFHLGLSEEDHAPQGATLEILLALDVVCVLPAGHPLCARKVLHPEDFADQDFIYFGASDPYRQAVDEIFRRHGVARRMAVETHSAAAVCATVNLGLGLAIVNPLSALDYAARGLQIRRFSEAVRYTVSAIIPQHRADSAILQHFMQSLRAECAQIEEDLQKLMAG